MPGGIVHGTENGCFAKTFALVRARAKIYGAVSARSPTSRTSIMDEDGNLDFFNESFTQNGRAVIPARSARPLRGCRNIPPVSPSSS